MDLIYRLKANGFLPVAARSDDYRNTFDANFEKLVTFTLLSLLFQRARERATDFRSQAEADS